MENGSGGSLTNLTLLVVILGMLTRGPYFICHAFLYRSVYLHQPMNLSVHDTKSLILRRGLFWKPTVHNNPAFSMMNRSSSLISPNIYAVPIFFQRRRPAYPDIGKSQVIDVCLTRPSDAAPASEEPGRTDLGPVREHVLDALLSSEINSLWTCVVTSNKAGTILLCFWFIFSRNTIALKLLHLLETTRFVDV